jgi:hypothetical protein
MAPGKDGQDKRRSPMNGTTLTEGSGLSPQDTELLEAAWRVFHSGDGKKKMPRGATAAIERAGMTGSRLHRSAVRRGEDS